LGQISHQAVSLFNSSTGSKERELDIRAIQDQAWENKLAKGFNANDVALEFGLLTAEVGEAFTAWRKHLPDLGEELADILIYLVGLAEMTGIDLGTEVERKLGKERSTRL
jgi:NTP pyrophosphatase (non-canonical NTP hydrolase)